MHAPAAKMQSTRRTAPPNCGTREKRSHGFHTRFSMTYREVISPPQFVRNPSSPARNQFNSRFASVVPPGSDCSV